MLRVAIARKVLEHKFDPLYSSQGLYVMVMARVGCCFLGST